MELERNVGTTTRIRIRDAAGSRFVKRPSGLLRARAITEIAGITAAEVRFYHELAHEVPVRVPAMVRGRHRPWGFELVRSGDELSVARVERLLPALAGLHARFWDDSRFDGELRWLIDMRRREVALGERLARPLMELGLARAGSLVPAELRAPARRYAKERARVAAILARGPRTLVHHDCHPGNLFWDGDGAPGFLDWQMVRCGSWASDVAYMFATGLSAMDRRERADDLLRLYLDALPKRVRPHVTDARWLVRAHTAYAFEAMLLTLALGKLMDPRDAKRLVARTALAVVDAGSFALLGL